MWRCPHTDWRVACCDSIMLLLHYSPSLSHSYSKRLHRLDPLNSSAFFRGFCQVQSILQGFDPELPVESSIEPCHAPDCALLGREGRPCSNVDRRVLNARCPRSRAQFKVSDFQLCSFVQKAYSSVSEGRTSMHSASLDTASL